MESENVIKDIRNHIKQFMYRHSCVPIGIQINQMTNFRVSTFVTIRVIQLIFWIRLTISYFNYAYLQLATIEYNKVFDKN